MKNPEKILVVRNDRLGDFMLAYPAFNVIKKLFPSSKIYALVPEYTKPMAELCEWIDEIIIDNVTNGFHGLIKTTSKLKNYNFDAALCLHSSPRIAASLFLAGIPHRFAPASRLDQIFYNHRLAQRRSRSEKPEFEYNVDLANFMGMIFSHSPTVPDEPPFLKINPPDITAIKHQIFEENNLNETTQLVTIHPGSGGSAQNLSIDEYATLIHELASDANFFFIITAGPGEDTLVQQLSSLVADCPHIHHYSTQGLPAFATYISVSDAFISGSTGILHIAGALNLRTIGFYPSRLSATSLRWKTLNNNSRQLGITLTKGGHDKIDDALISTYCEKIKQFLARQQPQYIK